VLRGISGDPALLRAIWTQYDKAEEHRTSSPSSSRRLDDSSTTSRSSWVSAHKSTALVSRSPLQPSTPTPATWIWASA
jgi:hypothetical protein